MSSAARAVALLSCASCAILATACGRETKVDAMTLEKMPRPVFVEARGSTTCGGSAAIDGTGTLWVEGGCGTAPLPFKEVSQLKGDKLDAFHTALDGIRKTPPLDGGVPCVEGFRSLALYDTSGPPRIWTFCVGKGERVPDSLDILVAR